MEGRRRRLAPQLLVGANVGRPGMAVGKRKPPQHCVAVEEECTTSLSAPLGEGGATSAASVVEGHQATSEGHQRERDDVRSLSAVT